MPMRCFGDGQPDYERYHDEEWGMPVRDEHALYERLTLEAFQSGLSWLTILRKRENFRAAFMQFDPERVAEFDESDVERLMQDAGIVRNRAKIESAINNAKAIKTLHEQGESLSALIWSHQPAERDQAADTFSDVPAMTAESKALAKALKQRGFRFLGPTTLYAAMQACGLVNDHLAQCPVRDRVEVARAADARAQ